MAFEMHFLERKCRNLDQNVNEICFKGSNKEYYRTGLYNGIRLVGAQSLTNDG